MSQDNCLSTFYKKAFQFYLKLPVNTPQLKIYKYFQYKYLYTTLRKSEKYFKVSELFSLWDLPSANFRQKVGEETPI
jgi:hypothetical protein